MTQKIQGNSDYASWFIRQGLIKDAGEQPQEEEHRARTGRVPRAGAFVSVDLASVTLPAHGCARL